MKEKSIYVNNFFTVFVDKAIHSWDFDYDRRFTSTLGYFFMRRSKKEVMLMAQYEFRAFVLRYFDATKETTG